MFKITNNTIGKVNLNNIKFDKKVTFNTNNNSKKLSKETENNGNEPNKFLNEDEQKALFIHLNEDISDYVSYEMIFQLILNVSQKFEKDTYSQQIFNIRRQLWLHFMPLIDNMPSQIFLQNKEKYKQYCMEQFTQQLK